MTIAHPGVQTDLDRTTLSDQAIANGEGRISDTGALVVNTGHRTGRSPKDRFYVQDVQTQDSIAWSAVNQPLAPAVFETLWHRVAGWLDDRSHYLGHYHAGAHAQHHLPLEVRAETAWHQLFAHNLFIRPDTWNPSAQASWKIINAPGFACDPGRDGTHSDGIVAIDLTGQRILIAGMPYAGEMKKAVFSALNYLLPEQDILPMHCSANQGQDGSTALFFGLSGTGKTTLSADPERLLIGDDEHGWGADGIFNFEGGCYAKCVDLSPEKEPMIHQAIRQQAVLENVVLTEGARPDYKDTSLTENTRAAYPLTHIQPRVKSGVGSEPSAVVFLTCDLTGVLPPVARLSQEAAAYHFLSGYTALVGSTELGSAPGIKSTFSMCFGAPFFPRPAQVYADLLRQSLNRSGAKVYLVNTGWTGGGYGVGRRFSIPETRAVITAIVSGALDQVPTRHLPGLNLDVPTQVDGLDAERLQPREAWGSAAAYDLAASTLIAKFQDNMRQFEVSADILAAGPEALE